MRRGGGLGRDEARFLGSGGGAGGASGGGSGCDLAFAAASSGDPGAFYMGGAFKPAGFTTSAASVVVAVLLSLVAAVLAGSTTGGDGREDAARGIKHRDGFFQVRNGRVRVLRRRGMGLWLPELDPGVFSADIVVAHTWSSGEEGDDWVITGREEGFMVMVVMVERGSRGDDEHADVS